MSGKNRCFEVTGKLEYFTQEIKDALIKWCNDNHYLYACILHDKDLKHDDDVNEDIKVDNHIHFLINTGSSRWAFPVILERFKGVNLKETMLQKVRKGWNNALSYLIHRTDSAVKEGKHPYEPSEVESNFDYSSVIGIIENQIEERKTRIDEVIDKIESLECRRYNINDYIDIHDYSKGSVKQRIELAFQYVETRLRQEKKDRNMEVYWIFGDAGVGKTTLAKWICEKRKWSYAVSSSSNDVCQDYEGQDVLILDDFRHEGWSKTDILKMLDNNTVSSVKSRYYNKQMCYLRAIIITSVLSPLEFWQYNQDSKESFNQLDRRIKYRIEMFKDNDEGVYSHTYFRIRTLDKFGRIGVKKIDFTDELEKIKSRSEDESDNSVFSSLPEIPVSNDIPISKVKELVDDNDVPGVTMDDAPF